jgi:uncharacterized membrane protein (DUF106 family)
MKLRKLYALYSWSLLWRFKIGIAYDVAQRIQQLQYELSRETGRPVTVAKAMAIPVFFPEKTEAYLHGKLQMLRAYVPRHAGHTEWFAIRNFAASLSFICLCEYMGLEWRWYHAALIFILPYPLDGVIFLTAVAAFQLAAVCLVGYGLLWLLAMGIMS